MALLCVLLRLRYAWEAAELAKEEERRRRADEIDLAIPSTSMTACDEIMEGFDGIEPGGAEAGAEVAWGGGGATARGGVTSRYARGGLSARGGQYCGYATARSCNGIGGGGGGGAQTERRGRRERPQAPHQYGGQATARGGGGGGGGSTARGAPTPRGTLLEPDFVIAARAATAREQRLRPLPPGMPDPMPLSSSPQYVQGMPTSYGMPAATYLGAQTARMPSPYGIPEGAAACGLYSMPGAACGVPVCSPQQQAAAQQAAAQQQQIALQQQVALQQLQLQQLQLQQQQQQQLYTQRLAAGGTRGCGHGGEVAGPPPGVPGGVPGVPSPYSTAGAWPSPNAGHGPLSPTAPASSFKAESERLMSPDAPPSPLSPGGWGYDVEPADKEEDADESWPDLPGSELTGGGGVGELQLQQRV
jgi:hypothetical protein